MGGVRLALRWTRFCFSFRLLDLEIGAHMVVVLYEVKDALSGELVWILVVLEMYFGKPLLDYELC